MVKEYVAKVHGAPPESGEWTDLLFKDSRKNKVFVVKKARAGVKEARLCFRHLEGLLENAAEYLPGNQHQWFYTVIPRLFRENLARVQEDLDWFIAKYDYRNASADWKNSRDAVSRSMQKLQGIYPADPPFKKD